MPELYNRGCKEGLVVPVQVLNLFEFVIIVIIIMASCHDTLSNKVLMLGTGRGELHPSRGVLGEQRDGPDCPKEEDVEPEHEVVLSG